MTFDYMKPNQNQFVNQKNIKDKPEENKRKNNVR